MPGSENYSIDYLRQVVHEDIPLLPKKIKEGIRRAIETRLTVDPIGFGKPLQYSLKGHRRLRVGHYRIIYKIDATDRVVTIIAIKHRKCVYQS